MVLFAPRGTLSGWNGQPGTSVMVESLGPRCLVRTLVYMELSMCIRSADQTARPVSRTLLPCLLLSLQILTGCQSPNTHDGWIHRNYKDYTHSYGSMKETGINSDLMSLVALHVWVTSGWCWRKGERDQRRTFMESWHLCLIRTPWVHPTSPNGARRPGPALTCPSVGLRSRSAI